MAFKFSLLNLERNECECPDTLDNRSLTMVRKSKSKKSKKHRNKFTKAVQYCHRITKGRKSFGKCMKRRLQKKK